MFLQIFFLTLFVGIVSINLFNRKREWFHQFPGPSPLPLLGNILQFTVPASEIGSVFKKNFRKFGNLWVLWIFNKPTLIASDSTLAQVVLGSYCHLEKHFMYDYGVKIVLGANGLITSDVCRWKSERKILNKIFNSQYLEASFNECVQNWGEVKDAILSRKGTPVDSLLFFRRIYFSIMLKSFNADPKLYSSKIMDSIEEQFERGLKLINVRLAKPWTRNSVYWKLSGYQTELDTFHKVLREYFKSQIESYSLEHYSDQGDRDLKQQSMDEIFEATETFLTVKGFLTDESIPFDVKYDHVVTIIAAAVDTSSIAVTMTLLFLANNPPCMKKVQQEIDDLFVQKPNSESVHISDLVNLKYLRQCIKETLRLHPPVPAFGRTTTNDIVLDNKTTIPKGTGIIFMLNEMHMNPEFFPNPTKYDPERFSEENLSSIKSCTYLPFSHGPRNCIGQKYSEGIICAILSLVLRNFSITTSQKPQEIKILFEVAGTPSPPVKLVFKER